MNGRRCARGAFDIMTMIEDISRTLVMLTAVIDPLGTVALFLIVAGKLSPIQQKKVAMRSVA